MFLAAHAAPRRRRRFFWTGGAPPPTEIDRRAAADTITSAHSSTCDASTFALCNSYNRLNFDLNPCSVSSAAKTQVNDKRFVKIKSVRRFDILGKNAKVFFMKLDNQLRDEYNYICVTDLGIGTIPCRGGAVVEWGGGGAVVEWGGAVVEWSGTVVEWQRLRPLDCEVRGSNPARAQI